MRVEAASLPEAFSKAAELLECSITQLNIRVIQHPRAGVFGFFKRNAIIEASPEDAVAQQKMKKKKQKQPKKHSQEDSLLKAEPERPSQSQQAQMAQKLKADTQAHAPTLPESSQPDAAKKRHEARQLLDNSIIDTFNKSQDFNEDLSYQKLELIKQKLSNLLKLSPFDIEISKLELMNENLVYIELNGNDAALLIGRDGHRYKALSYMLFSWLHIKFGYKLKLEISSFVQNQEQNILNYAAFLAQRVKESGRVQSRPLNGHLLKIVIEHLRGEFPDKYVGIKGGGEAGCVVVYDKQ